MLRAKIYFTKTCAQFQHHTFSINSRNAAFKCFEKLALPLVKIKGENEKILHALNFFGGIL